MSVARLTLFLGLVLTFVAGCSPQIPPAANYATVSGHVTDAASGAALANAVVTVNSVLSSTTDSSGSYRIITVPTGPWDYRVQAPPNYVSPVAVDNAPPLTPGEQRTVDIPLTHR